MKRATLKTLDLGERKIDYHLIPSKSARKLRIRVGLNGVEVVQPIERESQELETFLKSLQTGTYRRQIIHLISRNKIPPLYVCCINK